MSESIKRKPNTICYICKKDIYKRPSQITSSKGRLFCSQLCYGVASRKEISCLVCGKKILSGLNKKTCSRTCSNINRIGIKYKIGRPRDKAEYYRGLKIRLLKIQGPKCSRCSYNKYEILQIHHRNRDRNNNSLENLELICPNCHYEEHYLEKSWLNKHPI